MKHELSVYGRFALLPHVDVITHVGDVRCYYDVLFMFMFTMLNVVYIYYLIFILPVPRISTVKILQILMGKKSRLYFRYTLTNYIGRTGVRTGVTGRRITQSRRPESAPKVNHACSCK